jgi:phosphoesterase RecJ-like protein
LKKFSDTLRNKKSFLISTHVQPDGDGLGSEIALGLFLLSQGKQVTIINPSPTPEKFEIVDPKGIIRVFNEGSIIPTVDAVLIVDTNEVKMLGPLAALVESLGVPILYVDHHVKELQDTSEHLINESVGSSGELVFSYLKSMGAHIDLQMATALYVAIITDTGNFRYQRTSPSTHEMAAELLRIGVKPEFVFQSVFGKDSSDKIRLLGETLKNLKVSEDGKFAWVTIPRSNRDRYQASVEDTESFIGHLTVLREILVAGLFREEDDGSTKLSLRGLRNQPVIDIAKKFGGGGHKFAAGARIHKPLVEAVELVTQEVFSKLRSEA